MYRASSDNKKALKLVAKGLSGLHRTSLEQIMVPRAGLEPAHPKARDFKSLVSTDFTIWADGFFTANSHSKLSFKTRILKYGGWSRNRTGVSGFAIRGITILLSSQGGTC
jgi:hypothetical protein